MAAAVGTPLVLGGWPAFAAGAAGAGSVFDAQTVPRLAAALAGRAYAAPDSGLPGALADASYDQYRTMRYRAEAALWRDAPGAAFQAQFFHRGFLFRPRVDVYAVANGEASPVPFSTSQFDYTPDAAPAIGDIGFAGFRLHTALNRADYMDELCAFLGASYFRAVARGLGYGLSARGLALGSGDPGPEEFPVFRAFWLHRPEPGGTMITVDALLDSPSVAGAFRFLITPGGDTVFEVDARLYPRVPLTNAGIAPLTSMFHFDASGRRDVDDYRPAVHDSDGLGIASRDGSSVWRPLHNPRTLQHSGFQGATPRGFGLMQRKRDFADFEDAEAHYERRPSAWVEPLDDWGAGEVHLVEIPTADEYHDNIVLFWRPARAMLPGVEHRWRYRLHWTAEHRWQPELAHVTATRIGAVPRTTSGARLVVIDLAGGPGRETAGLEVDHRASAGAIRNAVVHARPGGGWRLAFEFEPQGHAVAELSVRLLEGGRAVSETWLYRWQA
ncbi:glucan biosynthesis protein [Luteimonas deserti]|uniref:Glucans biosynthesis protein D n=1 Tax=Luteimonas deserti TaxID=2752306 RepID=A0A7Z0TTU6_9GAMM|nr:glucan biosynthesis protein [Luteimonas deserti]NYZ62181.1 glucan biosynthesis protein [Luteimonas deserti]